MRKDEDRRAVVHYGIDFFVTLVMYDEIQKCNKIPILTFFILMEIGYPFLDVWGWD